MNENVAALLPETALLTAAVVGLLAGSWLPRNRQWLVGALAAVAYVVGIVATAVSMSTGNTQVVFDGEYSVDTLTNVTRLVVCGSLLLVLAMSVESVRADAHKAEFYVLLSLTGAGVILLTGANSLPLLAAAFLLTSLPGYALAGWHKDGLSLEAGLKFFLLGALSSIVLLVGVTVLYGAAGTVGYFELRTALATAPRGAVAVGIVAVLAGLLFEAGAVPVHFWLPDVTDGTVTPVAAYVTTVPKVGALVAAFRLAHQALPAVDVNWPLLVAIVAAASMTLGNLAAFYQTSVRRLLAYSAISQVGYLLMGVVVATRTDIAQKSLLFYLAAYAAANLGAFAVVAELPNARTIADYSGLARRQPALAGVLLVCLLALVGTPPTGVFVGKLEIFTATIDGGYTWLAVLAVVNTVASLFYYLRWLVPAFLRADAQPAVLQGAGRWTAITAYAAGVIALAIGIAASPALRVSSGGLLG